jgi:outer membrane usher protein FimD/PapC
LIYKGRPIRSTQDFSTGTLKDRRAWPDVVQTLRTQVPVQASIPCKNSQSSQMEKLKDSRTNTNLNSIYQSSPTEDSRWKIPTQGGHLYQRKKQEINHFNKTKRREPHAEN